MLTIGKMYSCVVSGNVRMKLLNRIVNPKHYNFTQAHIITLILILINIITTENQTNVEAPSLWLLQTYHGNGDELSSPKCHYIIIL